jgi:hypothetical protein
MLTKFLQSACIVIGLGVASIAQAVPVTFDLIGTGGRVDSVAFTVASVTVTATPLAFIGPNAVSAKVSPEASGLGVRSSGINDHTRQIDRVGSVESLRLTFDRVVELMSVVFSRVGLDDDFSLSVNGASLVGSAPIPGGQANDHGTETVSFLSFSALARTGTFFDFSVPGLDDDYRVQGITVNWSASLPPANPVPEPSAILLLGTGVFGLVGLGIVRERRQRFLKAQLQ